MKRISLFASIVAALLLSSCSQLEDNDHYGDSSTSISHQELKIVDVTSQEYMAGRADFSKMNELFAKMGIYDELQEKGQLSTMLVIANDNFTEPTEDVEFNTRAHVSDIAISPSNLHDGDRLMMWHDKYVNIEFDSLAFQGNIVNHIMFNGSAVKEVVKTSNGFIYVIGSMIQTPTSLYDYIEGLSDDYSIFRELVLSSGGKVFDKENSKAIGINEQGNTIYDSVFIYKNDYFTNRGFDMNSESLTATMLLPSNDVINDALADAAKRLDTWKLQREPDTLRKWILNVSFFDQKYTAAELQNGEPNDLMSIFEKQWRTNKHEIDPEAEALSNGVVYKIKKLHIPNNMLIYRLKECFYYYESCTAEQKEQFFVVTNMKYKGCSTDVAPWTPLSGVWPMHSNRIVTFSKATGVTDDMGWSMDFTPIRMVTEDGVTSVAAYQIPPGAYRLAMGFKQNLNMEFIVTVIVEGEPMAVSPNISVGSATTYHYDRGATLPNTYPEGYDKNAMSAYNSKAGNYDTDGGPIIDEVIIPDANGNNTPVNVVFRFECKSWAGQSNMIFNHWCLRPTTNNY